MTSYNILITCIGGGYASQNIKLIKKSKIYKNIKIIGIDINAGNEADFFCDFTYKVPHGSHQNYIKSVLRIVKKHQIKLIIPCSDEEAVQLSSKLLYFNKIGVNVACTNYNNSVLISSKIKTYTFLNKIGVNTPLWEKANSHKSLIEGVEKLFDSKISDVIIKPSSARGSRDIVHISKDSQNKDSFFESFSFKNFIKNKLYNINISKNKYFIISEKLNNPVFDLDFLTWKGELIQTTFRKRIFNELPNRGHQIIVLPNPLKEALKIISKNLNLSWMYDSDWMLDADGNFKIIEINPRMSGSISTSIIAGANYFDNIISLSKKKKIIIKNAKTNLTIVPSLLLEKLTINNK